MMMMMTSVSPEERTTITKAERMLESIKQNQIVETFWTGREGEEYMRDGKQKKETTERER